MGYVDESISRLMSIKIKPREDSASDQYNRIVLMKMCVLSAMIMGMNYFGDKCFCILSDNNVNGAGGDLVGSICWIQGFYIYKEMETRATESGYYGIPRNMDYDGIDSKGELCATVNRALDKENDCKPMEKDYYLQFQYFPFFMAILALLYYIPYMLFKTFNDDLISLRGALEADDVNAEGIIDGYFTYTHSPKNRLRIKVVVNVLIKFLYLLVNILTLVSTDSILHGHFLSFGLDWAAWVGLPADEQHDTLVNMNRIAAAPIRVDPKPANVLLPAMGFCDMHEATKDVRNTHINQHKFICEISPHVLYQYVLIMLWFLVVIGIALSLIGLLMMLVNLMCSVTCFQIYDARSRKLFQKLTLREIDYLEFIRKKNQVVYADICKILKEHKHVSDVPLQSKGEKQGFI